MSSDFWLASSATARLVGATEITVTRGALSERVTVIVTNDLDADVAAYTGDLSRDGKVDQADVDAVIHHLFAGHEADVNRDLWTSAADITGTVRIAVQAFNDASAIR
jgi:hypothetical protein